MLCNQFTISFHYRVLDQSVVLAMIVGLNLLGEHQLMLYQDVRLINDNNNIMIMILPLQQPVTALISAMIPH